MPRRRIYISSTYKDLLDHRDAAARIIKDLGHTAVDSYKAGPKPPVQQCLDDVESCDFFVGIVGHRYGWVPPDGDPRSITHREFDQAKDKTRLIFLLDDKSVDLDQPIKTFRASISTFALPALFSSLDEFSTVLRKTLKERVKNGGETPPTLLPYYCDRAEQYERIDTILWERRQRADDGLRIFVVHADAEQSGPQFLQVLECRLRTFPATKDLGVPVTKELDWPRRFDNPAAFHRRIVETLADKIVDNRHASRQEIERCIRGISGPLLLHTYVSTSEWKKTGEAALTEFCRFWEEWTELRRLHPLIVVLRVEYELPRHSILNRIWPHEITRLNKTIRHFVCSRLSVGRETGAVLDELPRIPVEDAIRWSHQEEIRKSVGGVVLDKRIRTIYQTKFAKEPQGSPRMDPLAGELMKLLKEHT